MFEGLQYCTCMSKCLLKNCLEYSSNVSHHGRASQYHWIHVHAVQYLLQLMYGGGCSVIGRHLFFSRQTFNWNFNEFLANSTCFLPPSQLKVYIRTSKMNAWCTCSFRHWVCFSCTEHDCQFTVAHLESCVLTLIFQLWSCVPSFGGPVSYKKKVKIYIHMYICNAGQ